MIPKDGLLGVGLNFNERLITDPDVLVAKVAAYRSMGGKNVVVTQGSYDLIHVGHMRYLHKAWEQGDFLIVLLDSDEKVRSRKGKDRPVTNEQERAEILCHLRWVNVVFLKPIDDERHKYVKLVKPDVLIVSESTGDRKYTEEKVKELKQLCTVDGRVVVLPPQAEDSTSARVRRFILEGAEHFKESVLGRLNILLPKVFEESMNDIHKKKD